MRRALQHLLSFLLGGAYHQPASLEAARVAPFCVSGEYYTIKAGDTCDSIALAHSVSSADVFEAATAASDAARRTAVNWCHDMPAGLEMCLPLTCKTDTVKPGDMCITISARAGIRDVARYNAWIGQRCDNLHEARATLGRVVCVSPAGGVYVPGTATNTSGIPGGGLVASSPAAAAPPAGATVGRDTRDPCGRWYVAEAGDTCAYITMAHSINLEWLAGMNPSVDARTPGGCSASLVPGNAYCVSPVSLSAGIKRRASTPYRTPLGCWAKTPDTFSAGVLAGFSWTADDMTLETCAAACSADGDPLAGFDRRSRTCTCGDRVARNSVRLSASSCTADMGDGTSLFGLVPSLAPGATLSVPWEAVGCFADGALVAGPGVPAATTARKTTFARCALFCLPDYPYFGVSRGDTCRCGTGMAAGAAPLDEAENCGVPCTGRGDATCGGEAATYIYASQIKINGNPDGGGDAGPASKFEGWDRALWRAYRPET